LYVKQLYGIFFMVNGHFIETRRYVKIIHEKKTSPNPPLLSARRHYLCFGSGKPLWSG